MENSPVNIPSKPEKLSVEKPDKNDADDKKKRDRAARHLHAVQANEGRPEVSREKAEPKPTSLAEIFDRKAKEIEPQTPEPRTEAAEIQEDVELATSTLAEARQNEVSAEDTEEAANVYDFLEYAKAKNSVQEAADQKMTEIGATPEDIEQLESEFPSTPPEELELELQPEDDVEVEPTVDSEPDSEPTAEADEPNTSATVPTPPTTPPPSGPVVSGPVVPGGPGGPTPPFGPSGSGGNVPPSGSGGAGNHNTLYPTPVSSGNLNMPPSPDMLDRGNPAIAALLGYVIGRRHGRKRAERRAAKEMKTYERQVKHQIEDIDWQMKAKEQQIRKLTREKSQQEKDLYRASRIMEDKANQRAEAAIVDKSPIERMLEREKPVASRLPAVEASQLHGTSQASEKIGQVLINAAEIPLAVAAERVVNKPQAELPKSVELDKQPDKAVVPREIVERQVETLNRQELINMSEKIVVDGTSLRQIYESRLISERGLRRLVAEHLHGGNVKELLRREIVEHEIDFERDPIMRDAPAHVSDAQTAGPATAVGGKVALDRMVQQASASLGGGSPEAQYYRDQAAKAEARAKEKNHQRIVDVSLSVVITSLVIAVIVLLVTRS